MSHNMNKSWLVFALSIALAVRKSEKAALDKQQDEDRNTKVFFTVRGKRMVARDKEHENWLMHITMFQSPACWKTKTDAQKAFNEHRSKTAWLNAVKNAKN